MVVSRLLLIRLRLWVNLKKTVFVRNRHKLLPQHHQLQVLNGARYILKSVRNGKIKNCMRNFSPTFNFIVIEKSYFLFKILLEFLKRVITKCTKYFFIHIMYILCCVLFNFFCIKLIAYNYLYIGL